MNRLKLAQAVIGNSTSHISSTVRSSPTRLDTSNQTYGVRPTPTRT
ncbi:hypothetical protein RLIN73S_01780 [Rhodanobacter lindaniclasticus]